MRTPMALLDTIEFIEQNVMPLVRPSIPRFQSSNRATSALSALSNSSPVPDDWETAANSPTVAAASAAAASGSCTALFGISSADVLLMNTYYDLASPITNIVIYLFVWDRYRMIAKDFVLMQASVTLSMVWVECAQRMVRWFVLMDHRMKADGKTKKTKK